MYNKNEIYEEKIMPLVNELKKACYKEHMPMFVAVAVSDSGKKTNYQNTMVSSIVAGTKLTDDRIAKMVNVVLGYDVVSPSDDIELEFDEMPEPEILDESVEDGDVE